MQASKDILLSEAVDAVELCEVLSPESYVYVALSSVEEGPNKAVFLALLRQPPSGSKGTGTQEHPGG